MVFVIRNVSTQSATHSSRILLPLAPRIINEPGRMLISTPIEPVHDRWVLESIPLMALRPDVDFFVLITHPTKFRFLLEEYRVKPSSNIWIGFDWSMGAPLRADQTSLRLLKQSGWNVWYQVRPGKEQIDLNLKDFQPDWAFVSGRSGSRTFLRFLVNVGEQLRKAGTPFWFDGFGTDCSRVDYSILGDAGKRWSRYEKTPSVLRSTKQPEKAPVKDFAVA